MIQQIRETKIHIADAKLQAGLVNVQGAHDNCAIGNALELAVKQYVFGSRGRTKAGSQMQIDMLVKGEAYEIMHNGAGYCMIDEKGNRYGVKLKAKYFIYAIALPGEASGTEYYVKNARVFTAEQFTEFCEEWGLFRTKDHGTRITMQSPDARSAKKWQKRIDAMSEYPTLQEWFGL